MKSENSARISKQGKIMIMASLVIMFLFMFLPVYQSGVTHTYEELIAQSEAGISEMQARIRELEGSIASARSPEALIDQIIEQRVSYEAIDASSTVRVARAE